MEAPFNHNQKCYALCLAVDSGADNLAMLIDDVEKLIRERPGMKATELAMAFYGPGGYHDRIGGLCRQLFQAYRIERRGNGGPGDPFRYYPAQETRTAGNSN
jgi:hypothetical protein